MKHSNWMVAAAGTALSAWMAGAAWAQNQTGGVNGTGTALGKAKPTPIVWPKGKAPAPGISHAPAPNTNMHGVNVKLRQQMRQVRMDFKAGKLTKEQAKAAFEKLKAVRMQENQYFRQNGQKDITADQKSQLEQMLDQAYGSNPSH